MVLTEHSHIINNILIYIVDVMEIIESIPKTEEPKFYPFFFVHLSLSIYLYRQ